ncbi:hypothetical protein Isop_1822 [Isosphaera pallida ATCC 43644]|uniref:Uncharacterized protein n=1 Tax=Isosphaera pallida (strain ATCC 43644 / DSM 9630 / IS1B) TaxID=575540 RepID=E8R1I7_ISOPI|nr:hypothetical protein [Isosphaera pallida]ADV62404.1 hypothetical protein Isop_1822 [Isosphaera pallida ATCC 43644]
MPEHVAESPTPPACVAEAIHHCVETITRLVEKEDLDRRDWLQLGYNLGRLSELTGAGRQPFWDAWKEPVAMFDRDSLHRLAGALRTRWGTCFPPSFAHLAPYSDQRANQST